MSAGLRNIEDFLNAFLGKRGSPMDEELRRFIIRGHEKVVGHCHFLLASPNLRGEDRVTLESRLVAEERALRGLIGSVVDESEIDSSSIGERATGLLLV